MLALRSRPASALACAFDAQPGPLLAIGTTFQWDASAGATGYIIRWGLSTGVYTSSAYVGNVTSFPYARLPLSLGVTYYMAAFATDGVTESAASNEIIVRNGGRVG